ncbi:MAG: glycoside hydrolase family 38 C-terminal domain-containing protein [bacterium]
MSQQTRKYTAYFCSHTHWDREWYGSFQEFRMRLVRLMDRLMNLLETDPDYRCFNLDGQTIVVEDYLEVKPEERARLEKHIRAGRIAIGPWYILPDEWLESGEAAIRNLLRGREICREFGVEPPRFGYLPDMFGQISQMPQILKRFGYDKTIMWRGLTGDHYMSELWWESPDGSRVLAFHLPEYCGYGNAAFFYAALPPESRTLPPDTPGAHMVAHDVDFAVNALRTVADRAIAKSRSGALLFMNGVDHMEPQKTTPEIIRRANQSLGDVELRHATFGEFMEALAERSPADLQIIRGEQRSTGTSRENWQAVLPNILSSRIYLKIANACCQTLLERWAEPFCSAAAMIGNEYPQGMIRTGWKWLLQNHPHDSIGGCSTDAVHRHMETRFEWAGEIADTMANKSIHQITNAIRTDELDENDMAYFVFNPLNWTVNDLVIVDIDFDEESGWMRRQNLQLNRDNIYQTMRNLRITNWDGSPVAYEVLDVRYLTHHRPWREEFGPTFQTIRFNVALWAENLPPLGYKGYRAGAVKKARRLPNRHASAQPARMSNEHLTVDVNPNGTLRVTGPALGGKVLDNLHYFEDGGDNGDGYTYSPPRHDQVVTSLGGKAAQITRLIDEDAVQAIAVDYTLDLPREVTPDRQHRSEETVPCKIRSVFRLGKHSRRIDVETTLTNAAKDHRLRVCFDVERQSGSHVAEMQFDVVTRRNRVDQPAEEVWGEDMPIEQPQQGFMSCSNLAIANSGLPEYEVADPPLSRSDLAANEPAMAAIKLTLLRAVRFLGAGAHPNTIMGGAGPMIETPEQQMIGRTLIFRYALIPHTDDWISAGAQRQAHQHNAMWRGMTTGRHAGTLPAAQHSFFEVSGDNIVLSALKQVENKPHEYVARFWNSGVTTGDAVINWAIRPSSVHLSNLAEDVLEPLKIGRDGTVSVKVKPKEIATILFKMNQ